MPDLKALGAWAPLLEKELHAPYFEELQKRSRTLTRTRPFFRRRRTYSTLFPSRRRNGCGS